MLVVLLLISQVSCEWVEISQNHYRKEPPHRATQQAITNQYEEKSKDNRIYRNNSVIEKQWNRATIDRVTNIGNIRRIQDMSVKTTSIKIKPHENEYTKLLSDNTDVNQRHKQKPFHNEEISIKPTESHKEDITKSINIEPVKQLQVINNGDIKNSVKLTAQNRRKITVEENLFSNIGSDENKIYKEQNMNKGFRIIADESNGNIYDEEYNIRNFQRLPATGHNFPVNNLKDKSNFINTTPVPKTTRIDATIDKDNIKYFQKIENFDEEVDFRKTTLENDYKFSNISITTKPQFHITKLDTIYFENDDDRISKTELPSSSNLNTNSPESINNENIEKPKDKNEYIVDKVEEISNATKGKTMNAIWKLVKIVTDTIYKNTHRSFKSKIKYLETLKATILTSIEEQFENVWPDDIEHRGSARRSTRSAQAPGHVEFPSSESTLMTISFLTFAVFLIKLVLQVIHTYKTKTMMVAPTVVAAVGRAAAAIRSQN